ncbi:MAG: class II fructose-bisphosphatase [Bacillati bacterium ANGP1]|uniref:Fructose-1,6-bisphosphatase n=1 Tax=Candidatus Segetimicrobium genomatis TaxID=2569760 RepID=A0A537JV40_9BACT|nr:MAG: class II fructose-bisphosphatase [Terrabacteria group bacterium ANGP1]
MERTLALDMVKVTEAAAIAAARHMGEGNTEQADAAAVRAMQASMAELAIHGRIVIGVGERDEAPMLYVGEEVGGGDGFAVDVAVDPVDGPNIVAKGLPNAIAIVAVTEKGGILHAPDVYMEKLIVPPQAAGKVDLRWPAERNLGVLAEALGRRISDITVVILDRPRHADLIAGVRKAGARIKLISDGDVAPAISAAVSGPGVQAVMGIGGAPEGVLTAAALRCLGGEIQGRFWYRNDAERQQAKEMGISDPDRIYRTEDLVRGKSLVFAATGITDGELFRGVRLFGGGVRTHSLVMTASGRQIRFVDAIHIQDPSRVGVIRL